jgi:hypothetical protein
MSTILYYSNFCEHSQKLLQRISKTDFTKEIHFICIDKRLKEGQKTYIVLENGNKIIMPENITRVPALLLLNQGYKIIYGEEILQYFKPKQEVKVRQATQNNMEPMAFSFDNNGFGGIVSDQYSFLDMDSEALKAQGNGGMRQMHSYVDLNMSNQMNINCPNDEQEYKNSNRISSELTIEQLQQQRENELKGISVNKPPI